MLTPILSRTLSGPRESLAFSETLSFQLKERLVQTHARSGSCHRCLRGTRSAGYRRVTSSRSVATVTAFPHVVLFVSSKFNQKDGELLTLMIENEETEVQTHAWTIPRFSSVAGGVVRM